MHYFHMHGSIDETEQEFDTFAAMMWIAKYTRHVVMPKYQSQIYNLQNIKHVEWVTEDVISASLIISRLICT